MSHFAKYWRGCAEKVLCYVDFAEAKLTPLCRMDHRCGEDNGLIEKWRRGWTRGGRGGGPGDDGGVAAFALAPLPLSHCGGRGGTRGGVRELPAGLR